MPCLLEALKKASNEFSAQIPSSHAAQPSHILLALKALSTGALEMNDTDFELLESYLKDSDQFKDSSKNLFQITLLTESNICYLGTISSETVKKNRPDMNAALLDQFVSVIPGAMFEKAMTQLVNEGEPAGFVRKDNTTQNLVKFLEFIIPYDVS